MKEAVSAALLTDLSCELSNEELGAAIRIISRFCESGKPMPQRTIHIVAGVDQTRWKEMEEAVLKFFKVEDQNVSFESFSDVEKGGILTTSMPPRSRQVEMTIVSPTTRPPKVPQYAISEKPEATSIRKIVYDQGVKLFMNAGLSQNTARSILAGLLKSYPEGDVVLAIDDASKKDAIAEPHTWVIGRLKAQAKKRGNTAYSRSPAPSRNQLVTPELGGISANRAERIRHKNANLKLDIPHSS